MSQPTLDRRTLLAGTAASLAALPLQARKRPPRAKGPIYLWLRLNKKRSDKEWKTFFRTAKARGVKGVHLQVLPSTHARWKSDLLPTKHRILERLLPIVTDAGLEAHAWIHALRCNTKTVLANHSDWYQVSRQGKSSLTDPPYTKHYKWLCPTRQPVRDYLANIARELSAFDGVSGVHLDFIRYPDVVLPPRLARKRGTPLHEELPQFDFCYCEACRSAFKEAHGDDPTTLDAPDRHAPWLQYRYDALTGLVNHVAKATSGKLSAAVFPTPKLAKKMVRQDWAKWHLDLVFPMTYQRGYEQPIRWLKEAAKQGVDSLPKRTPLYAGLLVSSMKKTELKAARRYAEAGGAAGVCLFNGRLEHLKLM